MKIDLTEALAVDQADWKTTCSLTMDQVSFVMGTFPIVEKSPVQVRVHHKQAMQLDVVLDMSLCVEIPCDRCLKTVKVPLSVHAERSLDLADADRPSYASEGKLLDIDELVFHDLLLHWPARVLCRDDCKGICPVCGADLNAGDCGCDRQVLDPRMAAIQDIFNKFQS